MRRSSFVRFLLVSTTTAMAVVAPLAIVACGTGAESTTERAGSANTEATHQEIIGGTLDSAHTAVVALLLTDGTSGYGSCSGSVVKVENGVGYVLTAAHCCGGETQEPNIRPNIVVAAADYGNYFQDIGNPNPNPPAYAVIASSVSYDQAYDGSTHDFCMLQFSGAPANMPTVKLPTTSDGLSLNDSLEFVGYGKTNASAQNSNSQRYHLTGPVDQQVGTLAIRYGETQGGVCNGDSGGPALLPAGAAQAQQTVVAVASYVSAATCDGYAVSSRVSSAMGTNGFITNYLAGVPQTPPATSACTKCQGTADSVGGACYSTIQACQNDSNCVSLATCLQNCNDDACSQSCGTQYPAGISTYNAIGTCVCSSAACATDCATECTSPTTGKDAGASDSGKTKTDAGSTGTDAGSTDDPSTDSTGDSGSKSSGTPASATTTTTSSGCSVTTNVSASSSANGFTFAAIAAALGLARRKKRVRASEH